VPAPLLLHIALFCQLACSAPEAWPGDAGSGGARAWTGGGDLSVPPGLTPLTKPSSSFSFVVIGDTQPYFNLCVPEESAFTRAILDLAPSFVLHTGDLMDIGRDPRAYDRFVECYKGLLSKLPMFPTIGNHDLDWNLGAKHYKPYLQRQLFVLNPAAYGASYKAAFQVVHGDDPFPYSTDINKPTHKHLVPSGVSHKTFYSFRHGNAYFISFEQGAELEINTPLPWLEKHLKAARGDPKVKFIIIFMHHPMYSTFLHEAYLSPVRYYYEPLFRKYDVTMVLSGHAHAYDRFHVPDDKHQTYTHTPPGRYRLEGRAIHYVVSGPAGGSFLPGGCDPTPAPWPHFSLYYYQARRCGPNMLQVEVHQDRLKVNVLSVSGNQYNYKTSLWDSFIIAPGGH